MSQLIASPCPTLSKAKVPLEAHQKAADYTLAKIKLGNIDGTLGIIILLLLTLGGGINMAFEYWASFVSSPLIAGVAATATIFLIMTLVEIPTSVYQTFVIEEKFGFNKSYRQPVYQRPVAAPGFGRGDWPAFIGINPVGYGQCWLVMVVMGLGHNHGLLVADELAFSYRYCALI